MAHILCSRESWVAGWLEGLGSESSASVPYFPSPNPRLSPLSPRLALLQLPQDVNSLKLLIKNILLSPPPRFVSL